jgi:hypothetical protein
MALPQVNGIKFFKSLYTSIQEATCFRVIKSNTGIRKNEKDAVYLLPGTTNHSNGPMRF